MHMFEHICTIYRILGKPSKDMIYVYIYNLYNYMNTLEETCMEHRRLSYDAFRLFPVTQGGGGRGRAAGGPSKRRPELDFR